jgi:hypothetical protein
MSIYQDRYLWFFTPEINVRRSHPAEKFAFPESSILPFTLPAPASAHRAYPDQGD